MGGNGITCLAEDVAVDTPQIRRERFAIARLILRQDAVQVPVNPQLVERQAEDTVYCSCRCANADGKTDDGANYCEKCPSGFSCTQLIDNLGLGNQQLAGAYCIRNGTKYDKKTLDLTPCMPGSCGEAQPF